MPVISSILSNRRRRRGQALLPMALALTALLGMAGLAIDTTRAYMVRAMLSNAVDGAALAAARVPEQRQMEAVAEAVFQANFPDGALGTAKERTGGAASPAGRRLRFDPASGRVAFEANTSIETYFMVVLGQPRVNVSASAIALRAASGDDAAPLLVLADEDTIHPAIASVREFCGERNLQECLNGDIAGEAVRAPLFARPSPPEAGTAILSLPTGRVGDEGLFRFGAASQEQYDRRSQAAFSIREFVEASGAAASASRLSEVEDVTPLHAADLAALEGREVCAVVFDGDITLEPAQHYGRLDGATRGVAAWRVTSVASESSALPELRVELFSAARGADVCARAGASAALAGSTPALLK